MEIIGMMIRLVFNTGRNIGRNIGRNVHNKVEEIGQILSGKELAQRIMQKSKKNCLIIKVSKTKNSLFDSLFITPYKVVDNIGNIEYKAKYKYFVNLKENIAGTRIIKLYNRENISIGYIKKIKEYENSVKCSLYMGNKHIIDLKTYKNSYNIYNSTEQSDLKIIYNKLNAYEFKLKNTQIAKLNIARIKDTDSYKEKYALEYANKKDENLMILLSIAIDILRD